MVAYDQSQRPAELGFILTDALLNWNQVMLMSATQDVKVDFFVHGVQGHCSTFTDNDDVFQTEWAKIQEERNTLHTKPGMKDYRPGEEGYEAEDLAFRAREMACLERSAYRMHIISKGETNRTTWKPLEPKP